MLILYKRNNSDDKFYPEGNFVPGSRATAFVASKWIFGSLPTIILCYAQTANRAVLNLSIGSRLTTQIPENIN